MKTKADSQIQDILIHQNSKVLLLVPREAETCITEVGIIDLIFQRHPHGKETEPNVEGRL